MKQTNWLCAKAIPSFIALDRTIECIEEPFSEDTILELQDKLLSPGFQHIKVLNVESGRRLIQTFLAAMRVYHAAACLTMSAPLFDLVTIDIYQEYVEKGLMEAFFFDAPLVDFIWIEMTSSIQLQNWLSLFQERLFESRLDEQIPVILISYEHTEDIV